MELKNNINVKTLHNESESDDDNDNDEFNVIPTVLLKLKIIGIHQKLLL